MTQKINGIVAVCGGVNIDIGGQSFAPLRERDSNPGHVHMSLGGVGRNIAHNLRLLGAPVELLTALGDDLYAGEVERSCAALGIGLEHALRVQRGRTSTYLFVSDADGDMALAVSDMAICDELRAAYFDAQRETLDAAALVVADANLPEEALAYLAETVRAPLFVDPVSVAKAGKLRGILGRIHTLKPNRLEAELLSGVTITDRSSAERAARELLSRGVRRVFLSLGTKGLLAAQEGQMLWQLPVHADVLSATGAGDAMMAALAWAHLRGSDLQQSAALGAAAAALAIESEETINPAMCAEAILSRAQG